MKSPPPLHFTRRVKQALNGQIFALGGIKAAASHFDIGYSTAKRLAHGDRWPSHTLAREIADDTQDRALVAPLKARAALIEDARTLYDYADAEQRAQEARNDESQ